MKVCTMSKRRRLAALDGNTKASVHINSSLHALRTDRRVCPHCSESLSLKTYQLHKRLYYDKVFTGVAGGD